MLQVVQGWIEHQMNVWSCVLEHVHEPSASRLLQNRILQLLHDCCRQTAVWSNGSLPNTQHKHVPVIWSTTIDIRPWNKHTAHVSREHKGKVRKSQRCLQPCLNILYRHMTFTKEIFNLIIEIFYKKIIRVLDEFDQFLFIKDLAKLISHWVCLWAVSWRSFSY